MERGRRLAEREKMQKRNVQGRERREEGESLISM